MSESNPAAAFPLTHWSCVARASAPGSEGARAALDELCTAYWYPIYAMIRRRGYCEADALDLTQEYFARLLEKPVLAAFDPTRGSFRAFLRADCGSFLAGLRDRDRARKRGQGRRPLSIDVADAEGRYRVEPVDPMTPERLFDRAWALSLLSRALDRLSAAYNATSRGPLFERLQGFLTSGPEFAPYAEVAAELGMSEAAVQQAVHRLRRRYNKTLLEEIAATLGDPSGAAVEAELRDLFEALGR